jgi:hypothetical protein
VNLVIRSFFVVASTLFASVNGHSADSLNELPTGAQPTAPAQLLNVGTVTIDDPSAYVAVAAISDVHGMYVPLMRLLKAAKIADDSGHWIAGRTLLIVAGDSIDKGKQSLEVVDTWISLSAEARRVGGRVVHLLGNHEAEYLVNPQSKKALQLSLELKARGETATELSLASNPRGQFLLSEPIAARVGKWIFTHSGLYPNLGWPEFSKTAEKVLNDRHYQNAFVTGVNSVLEARKWERDPKARRALLLNLARAGAFGTVFGHQPAAFGVRGRSFAAEAGRLIKIDNGMAPEAGAHPGSLLIFKNPAQMLKDKFPELETIDANGVVKLLLPE